MTHLGFPLPQNVASLKHELALFKFPIKIKVPHLEEEGSGSPYQNVSIKCQD